MIETTERLGLLWLMPNSECPDQLRLRTSEQNTCLLGLCLIVLVGNQCSLTLCVDNAFPEMTSCFLLGLYEQPCHAVYTALFCDIENAECSNLKQLAFPRKKWQHIYKFIVPVFD